MALLSKLRQGKVENNVPSFHQIGREAGTAISFGCFFTCYFFDFGEGSGEERGGMAWVALGFAHSGSAFGLKCGKI